MNLFDQAESDIKIQIESLRTEINRQKPWPDDTQNSEKNERTFG